MYLFFLKLARKVLEVSRISKRSTEECFAVNLFTGTWADATRTTLITPELVVRLLDVLHWTVQHDELIKCIYIHIDVPLKGVEQRDASGPWSKVENCLSL